MWPNTNNFLHNLHRPMQVNCPRVNIAAAVAEMGVEEGELAI